MRQYTSKPLQAAYDLGVSDEKARRAKEEGEKPKVLTLEQIKAMSVDEINDRWLEVQESAAAGYPSEADDE